MEKWFNKNIKIILIVLFFLLCIKTFQSCSRKASLRIMEKRISLHCDSLLFQKNKEIDSLKKENISKDYLIMDLKGELKIAGIKYDEAQKRADAVQKTAASVRSNTTIEVKGVERDFKK